MASGTSLRCTTYTCYSRTKIGQTCKHFNRRTVLCDSGFCIGGIYFITINMCPLVLSTVDICVCWLTTASSCRALRTGAQPKCRTACIKRRKVVRPDRNNNSCRLCYWLLDNIPLSSTHVCCLFQTPAGLAESMSDACYHTDVPRTPHGRFGRTSDAIGQNPVLRVILLDSQAENYWTSEVIVRQFTCSNVNAYNKFRFITNKIGNAGPAPMHESVVFCELVYYGYTPLSNTHKSGIYDGQYEVISTNKHMFNSPFTVSIRSPSGVSNLGEWTAQILVEEEEWNYNQWEL